MSKQIISVFGSTGLQGGSVLRSLIYSDKYHVRAITRNSKSDKALHLAKLKNVIVHEADLNNRASLEKCLDGSHGVFLVTDFWSNLNSTNETKQGINVIDSAIKRKVAHVVFSGLENVSSLIGKPCEHFDNKEKIEQYGIKHSNAINFTSIRLPAYYQVLTSMLLKKVKPNEYILTLPMGDKPMYCMNVDDLGDCVKTIFNFPNDFKSKIIGVAGDHLKSAEIVDIMNKHLQPNKIAYGNFSLKTFSSFGFPGVQDLTNMFEYYQTDKMSRDLQMTKILNGNTVSFNSWIARNKEDILKYLPV